MKTNAILVSLLFGITGVALGQSSKIDSTKYPTPVTFTNQQDHQNMQQQLGIKVLRPGPSGDESAPNAANYDEALANPCPELPDILTTNDGSEVTSAEMWWETRRPELVDALEREVYGKLPENIPDVNWEVKITDREFVARTPVIAKQIIGHVDNSSYPLINVDINMMLVIPANAKGPVPVLMMFGRPSFPAPAQPNGEDMEILNSSFKEMMIKHDPSLQALFDKYPAYNPVTRLPGPNFFAPPVNGDSPSTEQLLAAGWGYVTLDPSSIQADNHAGITRGIIGLVNKGQPRSPEDWGALRAWAWGAARALDYLETEPMVDSKKVGIEGVSRYGKAALVTMAFEPRFATALIGSSGKGGTTLHRRVFGEAVESLTGGENYWMAGNYMKYGAEESVFGKMTGCDLPVDSHDMLALCAPRPVFVSYGIHERGDAKWLDQKGSYMAVVAAGVAYKLLGAQDLGVSNDYMKEEMPPFNTAMLDGDLAWRQHDGGHTDGPNMQHFIPWANRVLGVGK
ncbi:glucuronyl esterase domain-containing protein [Algoriphagus halophytocola]|uniref:Acetylxylan esterase n=1 Tax=Algoriphagus halophytocola TaxID=2991499 RepID=A0ABY6MK13_9BACT|nr:acetylxylan esterase [Algoriphagus sp. TR-M5]UZD23839.1 acetylxylan esterase [Algoriphagus sp. TR-M5]